MNQKAKTLRHLLLLFKGLVINLTKDSEFDYYGSPVNSHTDWDYIPADSVEAVWSIAGNHAPSIDTTNDVAHAGFVITFKAPIGGNNQIYINHKVLSIRQIGNPAGWSYLGLGHNSKLYMSEDTADVMKKMFTDFHSPDTNYVDTFSNEEVDGQKDFSALPLYEGQPLVYQEEFRHLIGFVKKNHDLIDDYLGGVKNNQTSINHLRDLYSELEDDISDNYVQEDELKGYVPFTQLEYYVPKSDLNMFFTAKNAKVWYKKAEHKLEDSASYYAQLYATKDSSSDSKTNSAKYATSDDMHHVVSAIRNIFLAVTDLASSIKNEYASKYTVTTLQGQVERHGKEITDLEKAKNSVPKSPDLFPLKHAIDLKIQKVNKWAHDHIPSDSAISSVASSASNATHSLASKVARNNKWAHDHEHTVINPNAPIDDTALSEKVNTVSAMASNATSNLAGNQEIDEETLSSAQIQLSNVASASASNSASASSIITSLTNNVNSLDDAMSALLMTINNDIDLRND